MSGIWNLSNQALDWSLSFTAEERFKECDFKEIKKKSIADRLLKKLSKFDQGHKNLKSLRLKKSLTQTELAELIGIERENITKMESGTRSIGKEMAKRVGQILKVDYRVFL